MLFCFHYKLSPLTFPKSGEGHVYHLITSSKQAKRVQYFVKNILFYNLMFLYKKQLSLVFFLDFFGFLSNFWVPVCVVNAIVILVLQIFHFCWIVKDKTFFLLLKFSKTLHWSWRMRPFMTEASSRHILDIFCCFGQ